MRLRPRSNFQHTLVEHRRPHQLLLRPVRFSASMIVCIRVLRRAFGTIVARHQKCMSRTRIRDRGARQGGIVPAMRVLTSNPPYPQYSVLGTK